MKALNFNHIFGLKSVKKKEAVKFFAFTQDWAVSTPVNQTPTCHALQSVQFYALTVCVNLNRK